MSIFASMGKRRLICISLVLAYTFVFAHSVIPHEHHCHSHAQESHLHHFANCEQLETFLVASGIEESALTAQVCEAVVSLTPSPSVAPLPWEPLLDSSDIFVPSPPPPGRGTGLRAPPAA